MASTIPPAPREGDLAPKPAAFILAGDSTTASINEDRTGGGWGDGFLETLTNGAIGFNYGHNGTTTRTFRELGDWAKVIADVENYKSEYTPFVTIQFGHNDKKAKNNLTLEQYSANLIQLGIEVREAGGEPIFVTPLSERYFDDSGKVLEDLAVEAATTIAASKTLGALFVDLNKASTKLLNSIGAEKSALFNSVPLDFTHLNESGQAVFGNVISLLLRQLEGYEFKRWTVPNESIIHEYKSSI